MAVTQTTVDTVRDFERYADGVVDETVRDLVADWAGAWDRLASHWEVVAVELSTEEKWPSLSTLRRDQRTSLALEATLKSLEQRKTDGTTRINNDIPSLVRNAAFAEARMIAASMPEAGVSESARVREADAIDFNLVNQRAIDAIERRTEQQVTSLMSAMPERAYQQLLDALVQGVTLGQNPRKVAREIMTRIEGGFLGGLNRALTIARTEMIDAMREAQAAQDKANAEQLQGWRWTATFDIRTCPSCIAQDGEVYSIEIPGPLDHQNGRCARVPVTRTWRDLGFDIDEPEPLLPDGKEWFDGLSDADKLQIMGPGRLDLLTNGDIGWDDLSSFVENPEWRGSYRPTPIQTLKQRAIR